MTRSVGLIMASLAALLGGSEGRPAEPSPRTAAIVQIPVDTLRDLAVAVYGARRSVIYYNPALLRHLGPELSAFFLAHEHGHIALHHTRANALLAPGQVKDSVFLSQEFAADCYAADSLGREHPPAVQAAVRFFSRQGQFRYDAVHPTGAQRAANLLACLAGRHG